MRICALSVQNSSRIADIEFEVGDHLVVVGPNAVGKSTLLELIDSAIGSTTGRLFRVFSPESLKDPASPMVVRVRLCELNADVETAFPDEIDASDPDHPTLEVELRVEVSPSDPSEVLPSRQLVKPGGASKPFTQRHLPYFAWSLVHTSRTSDRDLIGASGVANRLLSGIDLTATDLAAFEQAAEQFETALSSAEGVKNLRAKLTTGLENSLPRAVNDDTVEIAGPSPDDPLATAEIRLKDVTGGSSSLADRSDGERALVALTLQQIDQATSAITGVDEPETHLHPRSQARIGRLLARGSGQRVVATHSPNIVQAFAPRDVVALTATGARNLPSTVVDSNAKFFAHWWVYNKIEALTAAAVVLLEGPSDLLLLQSVADARSVDLDRMNVTLVDLGSKNDFANAVKMLGPAGFGLPIYLLGDLDNAPSAAQNFSMTTEQLDDIAVVLCEPELETEYITALGAERVAEILTASNLEPDSTSFADVHRKCKAKKIETALALEEHASGPELESIGPLNTLLELLVAGVDVDG